MTGNNVPITIINDSKFINNFGDNGAAINFIRGGGLYIENSQFYFEYYNDRMRNVLERQSDLAVDRLILAMEYVFRESKQDIYLTYDNRIA